MYSWNLKMPMETENEQGIHEQINFIQLLLSIVALR